MALPGARIATLLQRVGNVLLQKYGGPVVFTADTDGVGYDEESDSWTTPPGAVSFTGRGTPMTALREKFAPGSLYEQSAEVLLVMHDPTWTVVPEQGQQVLWYGKTWNINAADPLAPEGAITVYWTVGLIAGA